jgi:hyaluronan synthase
LREGRGVTTLSDAYLKLATILGSVFILVFAYYDQTREQMFELLWASPWGRVFALQAIFWGAVLLLWSLWRLWLALRYTPFPSLTKDDDLPRVTIVVPVFNEGNLIKSTLHHLSRVDYPIDRFQIVVVDDGSDDDTWFHIQQASKDVVGPRLTAIRCKENRGKRWALWEGFRRGDGDIFVTVDSDSLIEPKALRALVSPIAHDEAIGAVAGNARVLNRYDGLVPRMLAVRYVIAFDYKRAAQSMMDGGSVLCVAGALAAYRRSAVLPALDCWLHQTFLGGRARAGEDHAMTNYILAQGYKVVYQRTARVLTKAPTTFSALAKMFLRWSRSNVRETIHLTQFIFTPIRGGSLLATRLNYITYVLGLFVLFPFGLFFLAAAMIWLEVFGVRLLAASVAASALPAAFYTYRERNTDGVYGILYGLSAALLLWWIWPFALATCRRSVWLTRTSQQSSFDLMNDELKESISKHVITAFTRPYAGGAGQCPREELLTSTQVSTSTPG